VNLESRMGHIKALVVNSIQDLPYDNVTVVLFPAEASPVRSAPAHDGLRGLGTTLWFLAAAGALALAAGGGLWWRHRHRPAARAVSPTPLHPVEDAPRRAHG